jgi:hypothetical protein
MSPVITIQENLLITLDEAKRQLREELIENPDRDPEILDMILEAQFIASDFMNRPLQQRLAVVTLPEFQEVEFDPYENDTVKVEYLKEVEVTSEDEEGNPVSETVIEYVELPVEKYEVTKSEDEKILITFGEDLPELIPGDEAVKVTLISGYNANNCPPLIKRALKLMISDFDTYREDRNGSFETVAYKYLRLYKIWN